MIHIKVTKADEDEIFDNILYSEHHKTRAKSLVLLLKAHKLPHEKIREICRITKPTLTKYLKEFNKQGVKGLKKLRWKGQPSKLNEYKDLVDNDFETKPPKSIAEARDRIDTSKASNIYFHFFYF